MSQKDYAAKGLTIQLPSLIGTQEFTPSGLMIKMLCAHLQSLELQEPMSVIKLLIEDGHSRSNWYDWLRKPGFVEWWNKACTDFHTNIGLSKVYMSIYRRAMCNSAQDAKIYLERFDDGYKPTSKTEMDIYPGHRPTPGAIARNKARLEALPEPSMGPMGDDQHESPDNEPIIDNIQHTIT